MVVAETGCAGFVVDFVQAGGSIGMWESNAAMAESGFQWMEVDPPAAGPTGIRGSALVREPVGVVGAITPFNFPFMLNTVKSAPALAAGCTVVLKPHPWTPLTAFLIAQAAEEAGLPEGVFNVITGHREVGEEMTTSPLVDMITMTGSTATGRLIMAAGAPTMKRLHLELGGKSAQVVLDDVVRGLRAHDRLRRGAHALRPGLRDPDPPADARAPARRLQGGRARGGRRASRSATRPTRP